jgi:uncharacterized lipoprotein YajG
MIRSFAAVAMLALLSGCAFTEDSVDIKYIATTASVMADAKPVGLTVIDGRLSDRNRISAKENGYGMEMAPIRSKADITDVVKAALKTEFEERGFHVDGGGRAVSVTITRFYNQFSVGLVSGSAAGAVDLTVTVADAAGKQLYSTAYAGTSTSSILMADGSNAAASIAAALKDASTKTFADPAFVTAVTNDAPAGKPIS